MQIGVPFPPMEPQVKDEPFDSPEFAFQTKWDGVRIMAHLMRGQVELYNRRLHRRTLQYPEMVAALAELLPEAEGILDGEMIAPVDGRPNFHRLLKRDWASRSSTIAGLRASIPVNYLLFDLPYWEGQPLNKLPFLERDQLLQRVIPHHHLVLVTDTINREGRALYQAVVEAGLEGIVAKRIDSPYLVGKKSSLWFKIKPRRQVEAVICGYQASGGGMGLYLGLADGDELHYIGRAGGGLSARMRRALAETLPELSRETSPFGKGTGSSRRWPAVHWVEPLLTVTVEFLEWTESGLLRHPVIIGLGGMTKNRAE